MQIYICIFFSHFSEFVLANLNILDDMQLKYGFLKIFLQIKRIHISWVIGDNQKDTSFLLCLLLYVTNTELS